MVNKISVFFLLLLASFGYAQETLFTIDKEPVYASEFIRVYKKNLDLVKDESQKDVDEYLKLFINYKLKLKEAYALELDKKPSYSRELNNYKKQLAKNFLTDTKVTDDLIQEAYERTVNEVNASHILVRLQETATPEDTLKAYNEILKLRERAIKEGFENVQKEVHNGQTLFGEDLGYFSAFKMVYDFETAAYNTAVGDVSQPFRTRFGYHIVKVHDKRKSRGEVTVAHIMVVNQKDGAEVEDAEERIQDIYQKLQQGEDFEALAKQFSDDKSSASAGGKLQPFSGGQLTSPEFESEAFGLKEIGDVTKPFETNFGWHIVKLYEKKPVPDFEALKPELEVKVKRDSRSQLINTSLINTLKTRYKVEQPDLSYFESILDDSYFSRNWKLPEGFRADEPLVVIGNKTIKNDDF
ncbi:MAG TPA: peptidylprolyl isomerase, partial [Flavobacteriaceae bacterium]|nr:peptidylprolyl isomerase [Flavobacteriaceae bacterium]